MLTDNIYFLLALFSFAVVVVVASVAIYYHNDLYFQQTKIMPHKIFSPRLVH